MSAEAIAVIFENPERFKEDTCREVLIDMAKDGLTNMDCLIANLKIKQVAGAADSDERLRRLSAAARRLSTTISFDVVLTVPELVAAATGFSGSTVAGVLNSTMQESLVETIVAMAAEQGVDLGDVTTIAEVQAILAPTVDRIDYDDYTTVTTTILTSTTSSTFTTKTTTSTTATSTTITTTVTTAGLTAAAPPTSTASSVVVAIVLVVLAGIFSVVMCCQCCYKPTFGSITYTSWRGFKGLTTYQVEQSNKAGDQRTHIVWRLDHRRAGRVLGRLQAQADHASTEDFGAVVAAPAAGGYDPEASPAGDSSAADDSSPRDVDMLRTTASDMLVPAGSENAKEVAEWASEEAVSPIMEPQTVVEYYSKTNSKWVTGRLKVQVLATGGFSRGQDSMVQYDVELSGARTQVRQEVPLWCMRPVFQEGETVEVFSRRNMQWARAVVADKPPVGGAQGNSVAVRMEEDGSVKTVATLRVRRRFPDGTMVKVYKGAAFGWTRGVIDHAAADGEAPPIALAMGDPITGALQSGASNVTGVSGGSGGSVSEDFFGVECPWCMVPFRELGEEGRIDSVWVPSYLVFEDMELL